MAVEAARGCGYRKAGGIYVVGGGVGEPCERLPIPLTACPWCKHAIVNKTRGFQWITAAAAMAGAKPCNPEFTHAHDRCPLCTTTLMQEAEPTDEFGLLFIGKEHYATPQDWTAEANKLGVSRRLSAIPKRMVIGKTWVLVGHPEAATITVKVKKEGELAEVEETSKVPGIFHAFRPTAYELIVTPSMKSQKWVKDLVKQGVTLVEVPENDPDHAPTVAKKSKRKKAMDQHGRKHAKAKKKTEAGA